MEKRCENCMHFEKYKERNAGRCKERISVRCDANGKDYTAFSDTVDIDDFCGSFKPASEIKHTERPVCPKCGWKWANFFDDLKPIHDNSYKYADCQNCGASLEVAMYCVPRFTTKLLKEDE